MEDNISSIDCPYSVDGCTFRGKESEIKAHLKECSFGIKEYIKEFLQKKEQEIAKQQTPNSTEQIKLIRDAIQKTENNTTENTSGAAKFWTQVTSGLAALDENLGISHFARETIGKTKEVFSKSEAFKKVVQTKNSIHKDLNETQFFDTLNETFQEMKEEFTDVMSNEPHPNSQIKPIEAPPITEQQVKQPIVENIEEKPKKEIIPLMLQSSNNPPKPGEPGYETPVVVRNLILQNEPVFAIDDETPKDSDKFEEVQLNDSNFEQKYEELLKELGENAEEDGFLNQKT